MQEEFRADAWADFKARYQHTFGWYEKSNKKKILVELTAIEPDQLRFVDVDGVEYTANADQGNVFTFLPVERSLSNVGEYVWYCTRHPARQWKRGLCHSNTRIFSLGSGQKDVNIENVSLLFTDKQSVQDLWDKYQKGERAGVAVSDTFAFWKDTVYLYDRKIGTITKNDISLNTGLFKQELGDVMQRMNFDCTIGLK
jgi:hypothetical protein